MGWIQSPEAWVAFGTLAALEIVLGIDNIIFISILAGKLPSEQRAKARTIGLGLAMVMRILLLLSLAWIMGLTEPLFRLPFLATTAPPAHGAHDVVNIPADISGRDLILLLGGLFLLFKSVHEIHHKLEGEHGSAEHQGRGVSFTSIIVQILLLDIVFSLDSVITAVGMVGSRENGLGIMISAVVVAVAVMLFAAGPISAFVEKHPTVKMLALSFLLLIGFTLVAEGFGQHIAKGYIYFAMGFSVMVEMLNLRLRKPHTEPVQLREPYDPNKAGTPV